MPRSTNSLTGVVFALALGLSAAAGFAQNPVQWSGSVPASVERAAEQNLPLLFWVSKGQEAGDDDEVRDAQSNCFRDPTVVDIVHKHFVPVRVSRTSKTIEEATKLGLPTNYALYCAVITHDGHVLEQMGPMEVADPKTFVDRLNKAYDTYCEDLYTRELRPIFDDPQAPIAKVRLACQTVWRLGILRADGDVIKLLDRPGLVPTQISRLYELIAALGTQACIKSLLDRAATDRAAAQALGRATPGALEVLMKELPGDEGEVTPRQLAAYQAVVQIAGVLNVKSKEWWAKAKTEDRHKEIERIRTTTDTVVEYWHRKEPQR